MQIRTKGWLVTCGAAVLVAIALVGQPEPARAQFGINIHGYRGYRGGRRHRGARSQGEDGSQSERARPGKPDKVVASEGAPSSTDQMRVLQTIASSAVVTDVGSTKDLNEVGLQSVD